MLCRMQVKKIQEEKKRPIYLFEVCLKVSMNVFLHVAACVCVHT